MANDNITKENLHIVESKSRARSSTLGKEGRQAALHSGPKRNVGNDGGLESLYFRFGPFSAAAATHGKREIRDTYTRLKRVPKYFRVFCEHFQNTRFVFRISMAAKRRQKDEHKRKS